MYTGTLEMASGPNPKFAIAAATGSPVSANREALRVTADEMEMHQ
jgi:hypothetical protein